MSMDAAEKTLEEMLAWLKEEGVVVAPSTLADFLEVQQDQRKQARVLSRIATGAAQCREVEKAFDQNPAPDLEMLLKLHRVLILQLATQGPAQPESLKLADQMTKTVLACISAKTKAAHKEREVTLAEQKQAEAKKSEQEKALEFCLDAAKSSPEVQELFKTAFAALKRLRAAGGSPTATGGSPVPPTLTAPSNLAVPTK